jgi:glycosyltransferase involved in cell wall biosynthesis
MRLSIILPAYKVEEYIERCIRSLENQDIPKTDYEIIITNDGSPDRSAAIVKNLQKEFSNIVLINQENQGVSMARNNAMAHAKGEYILPIDPDDYVLPNTLKSILEAAESEDLDVLYLGFEIFDSEGNPIWHSDYSEQEKKVYDGVEGYFASRGSNVKDPDRSWAILYRRSMLEKYNIKYPKDVPFLEDGVFISKVFSVAEKVGFRNTRFHQRTTSPGSATVSGVYYSDKAINGFIFSVSDLKDFQKSNILSQQQFFMLNHVIAKYIILSLTATISHKNIGKYMKLLATLRQNKIRKIEMQGLRLIYIKLAKIFNLSPLLFFFYFPIQTKLSRIFN